MKENRNNEIIENFDNLVMSPLANPIIDAIFASEKTAGLAAESIIRVILEEEGINRSFGKVIKVTPQRSRSYPYQRGSRVDVEILTENNEIALVEIQISDDPSMMQRNLYSTSHVLTEKSIPGTTSAQMAVDMPTIIAINILSKSLRKDNDEVLQPFKIMYTKPPIREAVPQFTGYNIQLDKIPSMKQDFNSGFYCWFYTLYTAHKENKTIEEVLKMAPELIAYTEQDAGYMQFCKQYDLATGDPESRRMYRNWFLDEWSRQAQEQHAIQKGREEGINNVLSLLESGHTLEEIKTMFNLQ
ncbi:MAG: PD-(D/E)XK nuclease family transposase [Oscillospiraceae bacterium]|jgi:predicted transposase/invertase (TIGR01784 family)|nr:PD-(D/E)XK nuclease family transposase [Oscillospiraceae bacterium]